MTGSAGEDGSDAGATEAGSDAGENGSRAGTDGPDAGATEAGGQPAAERQAIRGEVQEPGAADRWRFSGSDGPYVRGRAWTWDDEDVRRGLPWLGVFLVAFGAILLLGLALPSAHIVIDALRRPSASLFLLHGRPDGAGGCTRAC